MTLVNRERTEEITRLEFGDDWIEVHSVRVYGDTVTAQRAAASRVGGTSDKGGEAAETGLDISSFNLSLLTTMIVGWSDDEPITEETVQLVDNDIIQEVLEEISGGRSEEEKVPLERNSPSQSELPDESLRQQEDAPRGRES